MRAIFSEILLACLITQTGCSNLSPIAISLTDLGAASKGEHSMSGFRVMRAVNITGLGPNDAIGATSIDPDPPNIFGDFPSLFSNQDFPDSLAFRLSPKCSRVAETTFNENGNAVSIEDVTTIRDGVQILAELVTTELRYEIRKEAFNQALSFLSRNTDAQKKADYLKALQGAFPEYVLTDDAKIKEALDSVDMALQATTKKINEKQTELNVALKKPGIVTTRWNLTKKRSGTFEAVGAGLQAKKDTSQEGFLVLGSPKVATLIVGSDLAARVQSSAMKSDKCQAKNNDCAVEIKNLFRSTRAYMTYYQLSAKHLAWGETRSGASSLALQADIGKIASTIDPLIKAGAGLTSILEQFQVKVTAAFSKVYEFGNTGVNTKGVTRIFPFKFSKRLDYLKSIDAQQARAVEYMHVHSARGTLDGLVAHHMGLDYKITDAEACANEEIDDFNKPIIGPPLK